MKISLVCAFLFILLTGCGTLSGSYVTRDNVNTSVESLAKAFDRATLGLRARVGNGREFVSRYQNPKGDSYEPAGAKKERAYARLLVLNDRRPFDLQLQFIIEERVSGTEYAVRGYDDQKAQKILEKIMDLLASRPDKEDLH